ncbi:MAG TPA: hypothetical protein PK403_16630, partial [Plasticicumulans sp.]|nr:hypothetical protein [Plasticicumulans sp.]
PKPARCAAAGRAAEIASPAGPADLPGRLHQCAAALSVTEAPVFPVMSITSERFALQSLAPRGRGVWEICEENHAITCDRHD